MKIISILLLILTTNIFSSNLHIDDNRFFGFNKYNAIYSKENIISFSYLKDFKLKDSTHAFNEIRSEFIKYEKLDIKFVDANFNNISGNKLNQYNYFNFNKINTNRYECHNEIIVNNIYKNINLIIKENYFKYEFLFELMPGANIKDIKLKINNVEIDDAENLKINDFVVTQSIAFYENDTINKFNLDYKLNNNLITYKNDLEIKSKLIIDPIVLLQGTFYGGIALDRFYDMDVDTSNNVYAVGLTFSTAQIAFNGYQSIKGKGLDAFMVKFDSTGKRLWGTYFGGEYDDIAFSTKVKGDNILMAGRMSSEDFTMSSNAHQKDFGGGDDDGFFVEFNKSGGLVYSTYYGGTGDDAINGIDTDNSSIYITGYTESTSNIASGGHQNSNGGGFDAFLAKFNGSNRDWGTYLGGTGDDFANNIVFKNNRIIIVGSTNSFNSISKNGYQNSIGGDYDAFFSEFRINGNLDRSSYFGGNLDDFCFAVDYDNTNIYLLGSGYSQNLPANTHQTNLSGSNDGFIAKINGTTLEKCTYFGGSLAEAFYDIKCKDNLYVVGATRSDNNIAINTKYNSRSGNYDAILLKMDNNLSPIFSSYLGGIEEDVARSIFINDNIIIAGYTASTNTFSKDGHQNNNNGNIDGFISYFKDESERIMTVKTGTEFCSEGNITLEINKNFNLNNGNKYSIYLSNKNGDFNNKTLINEIKTIDSIFSLKLPKVLDYSDKYRIEVSSSNPVVTSISNSFTIYPDIRYNLNDTLFCLFEFLKINAIPYPTSKEEWYLDDELIGNNDSLNLLLNEFLIGENTIKIVQENALCTFEKEIDFRVKDIPQVVIFGKRDVCIGSSEVYSYASNYTIQPEWKVNGGLITSQNSNSITVEWNNLNSSIILNVKENEEICGFNERIEINSTRIEDHTIIGNDTTCVECIEDYYIEDKFDNYQWQITGGEFLSSSTLSQVRVKWIEENGQIEVNYSKNNCENNSELIMNYLDEPRLSISPNIENVCLGETIKFITSDAEFLSFTWSVNNAEIIENNNNNILVNFDNLNSATINLIRKNNLNNNLDNITRIINVVEIDNTISGIVDSVCINDLVTISTIENNKLFIEANFIDIIEEKENEIKFKLLDSGINNINIRIENEFGCEYEIDTNIIVKSLPNSPEISLVDDIIYSSSEFNIWYENDKEVIGNNSNSITPTNNNEYYARAIENGCLNENNSNKILYRINNVSNRSIKLYPNPSSGELFINLDKNYNNIKLEIVDLLGNSVFENNYNGDKINLNLKLKSGFYFIKIHSENSLIYSDKFYILN